MAYITTNPSPYLINVPELQNVITNASGINDNVANNVTSLLEYINTTDGELSINSIGASAGTSITIQNNLNLSNAALLYNGSNLLTSNVLNGAGNIEFQVLNSEVARITPTGLGIFNTTPAYPLSLTGNAVINGAIYISSFTSPPVAPLGNLYADGDVYARGVFYPSDRRLKENITPYIPAAIPEPIQFTWKSSGLRDIGVLADELAAIEPACVQSTPTGTLNVDYSKLVVLCLAEIRRLSTEVKELREAQLKLHQ